MVWPVLVREQISSSSTKTKKEDHLYQNWSQAVHFLKVYKAFKILEKYIDIITQFVSSKCFESMIQYD